MSFHDPFHAGSAGNAGVSPQPASFQQDRVIWTEGMFLRPQHLQQQDRYFDTQLRERVRVLHRHGWGVRQLRIDEAALGHGVLAVAECEGLLPDGTLFRCQGQRLLREIAPGRQNITLYLGLPVALAGIDEADPAALDQGLTRWIGADASVQDSNLGASKTVPVKVARPRFRLLLEEELSADYSRIAIVRIRESHADGRLELDEHFIPPCLDLTASHRLTFFLGETLSLLNHRAQAIASRIGGPGGHRGSSELADFLLLQLVNRYAAQLRHLTQVTPVHPEEVFQILCTLHAEMATFTQDSKLPVQDVPYDHGQLTVCFSRIMGEIRQGLSLVFEQTALALPLQQRRFGVRVAPIQDRALLDQAQFFLAIKTDWPKETVSARMPTVIKAGGVEQLRELVNLQLPGIELVPLPVAPRQIPYNAGFTYFQLEKTPENWAHLKRSGGIAFHFSGEVPGLELELWAVKG